MYGSMYERIQEASTHASDRVAGCLEMAQYAGGPVTQLRLQKLQIILRVS